MYRHPFKAKSISQEVQRCGSDKERVKKLSSTRFVSSRVSKK